MRHLDDRLLSSAGTGTTRPSHGGDRTGGRCAVPRLPRPRQSADPPGAGEPGLPELVARLLLTEDVPSFLDEVAELLVCTTVGLLACTAQVRPADGVLLTGGRFVGGTGALLTPTAGRSSPVADPDANGWDAWGPWRSQAGGRAARLDLPLLTTAGAGRGLLAQQVGVLTLYARDEHAISAEARRRLRALAGRAACATLIALPPARQPRSSAALPPPGRVHEGRPATGGAAQVAGRRGPQVAR